MLTDIIKAFFVGGAICAVVQLLIDYTRLTPARILTGAVVAGVLLSAVGVYGPLAEFAGAGATVPLTGFGHLLAEGVRKAVREDGLIGVFTGGLTAASGGIAAALIAGLTAAAIFPQKDKN
ncbi:MAG: SpoVA/SpoVAEb family sporulation membrane protein [Ruminococcus sp.]|nr:SpoVA/SpoVAEb family sporulation membrane protein [Ruminococcus sp.]